MQIFISLGKPWEMFTKFLIKLLISRCPLEVFVLISFVLVVQQFINDSFFAIIFYIIWVIFVYFLYVICSYCKSETCNNDFKLNSYDLIEILSQLPNHLLLRKILSHDSHDEAECINYFFKFLFKRIYLFLNHELKNFKFYFAKHIYLDNIFVGINSPWIENLSSELNNYDHGHYLTINLTLFWHAKSEKLDSGSNTNENQLAKLKFYKYTIGSLISFFLKANCKIKLNFIHQNLNEEPKLKKIEFCLTKHPNLFNIKTSGFLWFLDKLFFVNTFFDYYLVNWLLYPKVISFETDSTQTELRKLNISYPVAIFNLDIIQAENIPSNNNSIKLSSKIQEADGLNVEKYENKLVKLSLIKNKSNGFLNCLTQKTFFVYCKINALNQFFFTPKQFLSSNPFWNFRCSIPILNNNLSLIKQMNNYNKVLERKNFKNPLDFNKSFYYSDEKIVNNNKVKKNLVNSLFKNLSFYVKLIVIGKSEKPKALAEFSFQDPSQYFFNSELNGQSVWINSKSTNTSVNNNLNSTIKLNVRFTIITLGQYLTSTILSNAYLANRLAFPIGSLLVFIDSAANPEIDKLHLISKSKFEVGYQIICQLGSQVFQSKICTNQSFVWESELLFCVYSVSLEKLFIKLVLNETNNKLDLNSKTIADGEIDLLFLLDKPFFIFKKYCKLKLEPSHFIILKLFLCFRIINFSSKMIKNHLRNSKVAEEDSVIKDKQFFNEKSIKENDQIIKRKMKDKSSSLSIIKKNSKSLHQAKKTFSNDEVIEETYFCLDENSNTGLNTNENVNVIVFVRLRWPKLDNFIIEVVDVKCPKFLAFFHMYSLNVYLNVVVREKEKALQSRKTQNFQLTASTVTINKELSFNCITKPLSCYHLNISLHEKRTEEYNKIAEVYAMIPSLILSSGYINKHFILRLTPIYLKTSGLTQ